MSKSARCLITLLVLSSLFLLTGCTSTPLIKAAVDGDLNGVMKLVAQGDPVNVQDCHTGFDYVCCTPITCAANKNHVDIVKYLHEHGADINTVDASGHFPGSTRFTPLHYAAYRGNIELAYYLLSKGASISSTTSNGLTPLKLAELRGHANVKEVLAAELKKQYVHKDDNSSGSRQSDKATLKPSGQIDAEKTRTTSDIDNNIPAGKPAGKFDIAVVIGNHSYSSSGTPNVDYALNDARTVREYLTKTLGYDPANIIYLENATLTKLYEVFGTKDDHRGKLFKWVKPGQSRVFIYYAGHGAPDQESGEAYFVPVDANPQYIRTGGYKLSTFYENLSKIPAAKKTVVIDACFSGSSPNGQLLKGVSGLVARMKSEPKAASAADILFTSAGMDQVASWYPEKGHSLFTYFFLKGLQGGADTNKDGRITAAEMKTYLNDQVPYMARRLTGNEQQPQFTGSESDEISGYPR